MIKPSHPQSPPWIKICGLTRMDNALAVAQLSPDAIGFVFFKKSPRNVSVTQAARICEALPEGVQTIGVFVDDSYETIIEKVDACGLSGVQLHGTESPKLVDRLLSKGLIVIKALFATRPPYLNQADDYKTASFLLVEYGQGTLPGGNAEVWNYETAGQLSDTARLVLAGGLDAENVKQAIALARPAGVDISSGVEKCHGIKDLDKVAAFISAVRS